MALVGSEGKRRCDAPSSMRRDSVHDMVYDSMANEIDLSRVPDKSRTPFSRLMSSSSKRIEITHFA